MPDETPEVPKPQVGTDPARPDTKAPQMSADEATQTLLASMAAELADLKTQLEIAQSRPREVVRPVKVICHEYTLVDIRRQIVRDGLNAAVVVRLIDTLLHGDNLCERKAS